MDIKITKDLAERLGEEKLRIVGLEWNARGYHYDDDYTLNLAKLTSSQITTLREWLDDFATKKIKGAKILVQDIDLWKRALADAGKQRPRTVKQFSALLIEYLRKVPGHRIYRQLSDEDGKTYVAYYVNHIVFHPESGSGDNYVPPSTDMNLLYNDLGGRMNQRVNFVASTALGMTASETLAKAGFFAETPALRKAYLTEAKLFNEIAPQIGTQYLAYGTGKSDPDDMYSRFGNARSLSGDKVVIDVFSEVEGRRRGSDRDTAINQFFWSRVAPIDAEATEGDVSEEDIVTETGDATNASTAIEVPVHPFCVVFDLRRHLRMRIHVNFLKLYKYDLHMDTKLILPKVTKDLVATLIAQSRTGFSDIIEGKGLGVAVLLGGPPGVGKTLTAEVFAEASERPLYSIQAAQLGIKSDEVEKNLAQFLARGSRWNAIVLIDEADVYIRSRDRDMEHNAIVASLLRVLEYQTSILFMTTNLAKEVDDAIVSRCIARINYTCPTKEEQADIWRVIADLNNVKLSDGDIAENVKRHPTLTGRDIKQLLKLAVLHSAKDGGAITPSVIDFVSQFQPTINENGLDNHTVSP